MCYIFKTKELVAPVWANGPRVDEELLKGCGLQRVGVFLRGRVGRRWACRALQTALEVPLPRGAWSIACGRAHSAGLEASEERSHGGGPAVRSKGNGGECGLEAGRAFVLTRQRRRLRLEQALGDGPCGESGPGSSNSATWAWEQRAHSEGRESERRRLAVAADRPW
jgi:hypothetical protein